MDDEMDISTIPHQDLINKYYELHEKQERNKSEIEELLQQNYSLKRRYFFCALILKIFH